MSDQSFADGFYHFVRKETKEHVCVECGSYSYKPVIRKFINSKEAKVTLKCELCEGHKEVTMHMFD